MSRAGLWLGWPFSRALENCNVEVGKLLTDSEQALGRRFPGLLACLLDVGTKL